MSASSGWRNAGGTSGGSYSHLPMMRPSVVDDSLVDSFCQDSKAMDGQALVGIPLKDYEKRIKQLEVDNVNLKVELYQRKQKAANNDKDGLVTMVISLEGKNKQLEERKNELERQVSEFECERSRLTSHIKSLEDKLDEQQHTRGGGTDDGPHKAGAGKPVICKQCVDLQNSHDNVLFEYETLKEELHVMHATLFNLTVKQAKLKTQEPMAQSGLAECFSSTPNPVSNHNVAYTSAATQTTPPVGMYPRQVAQATGIPSLLPHQLTPPAIISPTAQPGYTSPLPHPPGTDSAPPAPLSASANLDASMRPSVLFSAQSEGICAETAPDSLYLQHEQSGLNPAGTGEEEEGAEALYKMLEVERDKAVEVERRMSALRESMERRLQQLSEGYNTLWAHYKGDMQGFAQLLSKMSEKGTDVEVADVVSLMRQVEALFELQLNVTRLLTSGDEGGDSGNHVHHLIEVLQKEMREEQHSIREKLVLSEKMRKDLEKVVADSTNYKELCSEYVEMNDKLKLECNLIKREVEEAVRERDADKNKMLGLENDLRLGRQEISSLKDKIEQLGRMQQERKNTCAVKHQAVQTTVAVPEQANVTCVNGADACDQLLFPSPVGCPTYESTPMVGINSTCDELRLVTDLKRLQQNVSSLIPRLSCVAEGDVGHQSEVHPSARSKLLSDQHTNGPQSVASQLQEQVSTLGPAIEQLLSISTSMVQRGGAAADPSSVGRVTACEEVAVSETTIHVKYDRERNVRETYEMLLSRARQLLSRIMSIFSKHGVLMGGVEVNGIERDIHTFTQQLEQTVNSCTLALEEEEGEGDALIPERDTSEARDVSQANIVHSMQELAYKSRITGIASLANHGGDPGVRIEVTPAPDQPQHHDHINTLQSQLTSKIKLLAVLEEEMRELRDNSRRMDMEKEKLNTENARLEKERVRLENEHVRLEKEKMRLENENVRLENERERMEKENRNLENEKVGLESEKHSIFKELEYLKTDNTKIQELETIAQSKTLEVEIAKREVKEKVDKLELASKQFKSRGLKILRLEEIVKGLTAELDVFRKENGCLDEKNKTLEKETNAYKDKFNSAVKGRTEYMKKSQELSNIIEGKDEEIAGLGKQLEDVEGKMKEVDRLLNESESVRKEQDKRINELSGRSQHWEEISEERFGLVKNLQESLTEKSEESKKLKERLILASKMNCKVEVLEAELARKQGLCDNMQRELAVKAEQAAEVAELKKNRDDMVKRIDQLKGEVQRLANEKHDMSHLGMEIKRGVDASTKQLDSLVFADQKKQIHILTQKIESLKFDLKRMQSAKELAERRVRDTEAGLIRASKKQDVHEVYSHTTSCKTWCPSCAGPLDVLLKHSHSEATLVHNHKEQVERSRAADREERVGRRSISASASRTTENSAPKSIHVTDNSANDGIDYKTLYFDLKKQLEEFRGDCQSIAGDIATYDSKVKSLHIPLQKPRRKMTAPASSDKNKRPVVVASHSSSYKLQTKSSSSRHPSSQSGPSPFQ